MEVVQAEVADVDLLLVHAGVLTLLILLFDLEESVFDLFFNLWVKGFLLVVQLQILILEIL